MKKLLSILVLGIVLLAGNAFAQDTTKRHDRTNFQGKEQKKKQLDQQAQKQKRNRANRVEENLPNSEASNVSIVKQFIDEDGDGVNDFSLDSDGDGIPNGQDLDYVKSEDGSGEKHRVGNKEYKSGGSGTEGADDIKSKAKQKGVK